MHGKVLTALIMCAASALPVLAGTIHVAPCGDDAWTGASPVCAAPDGPKRTIQAGIYASVDGDVVLIADGTYMGPGNRDMDYGGRAITLRGAGGASACIIDCQGSPEDPHRGFFFYTGETGSSVLEGITVRNGSMPIGAGDYGGAVYCIGSSPSILGCRFDHNSAGRGGAIYADTASTSLVLVDCTFSENNAEVNGGAIYVFQADLDLAGCTFSENTAVSGGGAVFNWDEGHRVFTNCTFDNNSTSATTGGGGGAISSTGDTTGGTTTLTGCEFIGNSTPRLGGGVWFRDAQATVTDCTFGGNSAVGSNSGGGGIAASADSQLSVTNCLFTTNSTGEARPGSAVWVGDGLGGPSSATITNCTFSQNTAPSAGAAVFVTQTSSASVANSVLWGNTPAQVGKDPGATATVSYSDIQGGWTGLGTDNINADPLFISAIDGDCRLSASSPCIDAGNSLVDIDPFVAGVQPLPVTDLDGLPRRIDTPTVTDTGVGPPVVDMGAYEVQLCAADLNGDGLVDFADYLEFLNLYDAGDLRADFNGDGIVDFADYLEFLNHFDAGC